MPKSFLTARVSGVHVGFPLDAVREVYPLPPVTPVPGSAPRVVGLVNVRGDVVAAMDTASMLGLPAGTSAMAVAVADGDATCAFVVDEVGQVLEEQDLDALPPTLSGPLLSAGIGIGRAEDGHVVVVDAGRLLAA